MEISERVHNLCMIYPNELNEIVLLKELEMLSSMVGPVKNISELKEKMKNTSSALDKFLPNVHTLLRLSCLIPVTTATSERSFSALRRTKTYLRTTMTQGRSCALVVLSTHRSLLDCVSDESIAQQFVLGKPERKAVFGCF